MKINPKLDVKPDVAEALSSGKPVVALESTIISHGMPYPKNIETAAAVEDIVRTGGAVPATIAIIGGKIKIGLERDELEFLGTSKEILKASRRDLGHIVANGLHGATTVAATMIAANLAGIRVFVTGGIGGFTEALQALSTSRLISRSSPQPALRSSAPGPNRYSI